MLRHSSILPHQDYTKNAVSLSQLLKHREETGCKQCKEPGATRTGETKVPTLRAKHLVASIDRAYSEDYLQKLLQTIEVSTESTLSFDEGKVQYGLEGLIKHQGDTTFAGHYFSFWKPHPEQGEDYEVNWVRCDDQKVSPAHNDSIISRNAKKNGTKGDDIAMLFYHRL